MNLNKILKLSLALTIALALTMGVFADTVWTTGESTTYKLTGNVGIGTTDPGTAKLKVVGNIVATGTITTGSSRTLKKDIEEVPDMVAINDRKGLNSMDLVTLEITVIQEQQIEINELKIIVAEMSRR